MLPEFTDLTVRIVVLALAIVGNALAGALYIGAGLGPGPRDGLMTGLVGRGIGSIRLVRTTIELTVLGIGWVLGGVVGVGTVVYALAIGPLLHLLLPAPAGQLGRARRSRRDGGAERSAVLGAGGSVGSRGCARTTPPAVRRRRAERVVSRIDPVIGVLALQGDVREHLVALAGLGVDRPAGAPAVGAGRAGRHRHPRRGIHHDLPAAGRLRAARAAVRSGWPTGCRPSVPAPG